MPVRLIVAVGKCEEHGTPGGTTAFVEHTRAQAFSTLALAAIDAIEEVGRECEVEIRVLVKPVHVDDLTPQEREHLAKRTDRERD